MSFGEALLLWQSAWRRFSADLLGFGGFAIARRDLTGVRRAVSLLRRPVRRSFACHTQGAAP